MSSKWLNPNTRLAIILRDDSCCAYCGTAVEDGARLTVDHIMPRALGGDNSKQNLVTCCSECNETKGDMHPDQWFVQFDESVAWRVWQCVNRDIKSFRKQAREMLHNRSIAQFTGNREYAKYGGMNGNGKS